MGKTSIEWTDYSWNPIRAMRLEREDETVSTVTKIGWHCEHVSEACRNCYAEAINRRLGTGLDFKPGHRKNIEIFLDEKMLLAPLKWKRPRKIFVCSMTDLGADFVTDDMLDRIFAIAALCPQHTFLVLTKRPERMRGYISACVETFHASPDSMDRRFGEICVNLTASPCAAGAFEDVDWPLRNVWLGTSCEDQDTANERIPHLLETPAAVRFLSCEPLLGQINIKAAIRPRQPMRTGELPENWENFIWPAWVPSNIREAIVDFWGPKHGRVPKDWLRDAIAQGGPALWSDAELRRLTLQGEPVRGRFVHLWNNIGCVVQSDGSLQRGSFVGSSVYTAVVKAEGGLDWVIAGGESGPNARPMHPDWVRSLRNQCAAASVPFFFKQWGDWQCTYDRDQDDPDWRNCPQPREGRTNTERYLNLAGGWGFHGERVVFVKRVGKARAGRSLDGVEHNDFPEAAP